METGSVSSSQAKKIVSIGPSVPISTVRAAPMRCTAADCQNTVASYGVVFPAVKGTAEKAIEACGVHLAIQVEHEGAAGLELAVGRTAYRSQS